MAEETITLPKSGVVLERRGLVYVADGTDIRFRPDTRPYGSCPVAWCRNDAGHAFDCDDAGALAWLDEQVMKLRAALLPPGAIVVSDTEETRERIARKLNATHREFAQTPNSLCYDCDCPDQDDNAPPPFDEMCDGCKSSQLEEASAVLAALRESRP